jgi:hypothetical protein
MVIWMQMIMGSGTSAILLNVVSHKKIHYKRGVKQVTHSPPPLLFVLAVGLLQSIINNAMHRGIISLPIPNICGTDFPII